MLGTLLLTLVAASEPVVSEVRLEPANAEAQRLVTAAGVQAGLALDAEKVRQAVLLLFATGRYEDVRARTQATAKGAALSFELIQAPRLGTIVVEGTPLLSAGRIQALARWHPAEPLWPARLARAEREVSAELVGRGYLDASVSASARPTSTGLFQAVFVISPGPRVRVGRLEVRVPAGGLAPALQALARPRPGEPFERAQAQAAAERMRRQLVALGHWRGSVQPRETREPGSATLDLAWDVDPGPLVVVEYEGTHPSAGVRHTVSRLLRDGGLSADVVEEGGERIEAALRAQGHRDATVSHREESRAGRLVLVYAVQPGPAAQVLSVAVRGADEVMPPLATTLSTRLAQPLEERTLAADARALREALLERGYLRASVEPEAPEGGGLVPVVFRVRPGPRTLVRDVGIALNHPVALAASEAPPALRLRAGAPYRERDLALDRSALLQAYRNAGYLQAEVTPQVLFSDDRAEVGVRLQVEPGPRTRVGTIVVAGLNDTRESVVRRELLVEEGQPLGAQKLLDSQRRLSALGLFQRVSVRELDPEAGDTHSLLVTAEEGAQTTLGYGLGYAEREGARASLEVTRRNLFGLDRTLTLFGRYGTRANRMFASFREPYLLGRRQELFLTGFREEENRAGFSFIRLGTLVQTARSLTTRTSLILRYAFQRTRLFRVDVPLDEIDRQLQASTTSGPSLSLLFDSRDDPIDPHRGRFVSGDAQLSLPLLQGDRFVKSYVQASTYERLGPRLLLAVGARLGLAATFGNGEPERLPLPDRFFAGGDYSVRGFQTDFAGPLELGTSGKPVPTGGNALLIGSAELRFDLTRAFSLAAFSDVGNVFPDASDLQLGDLRPTAGMGLRYRSALGPLRLDWGFKLDRRRCLIAGTQGACERESLGHLHVTIGHAF